MSPRCALILMMLVAAGCNPGPMIVGAAAGPSNRPRAAAAVPAGTADVRPRIWERWAEVGGYRVAIPRGASQHFALDHEGETLASDAAAPYPDLGPARAPGVGAVLVQRLYAPGATAPEALFVMVKRAPAPGAEGGPRPGGGWEYLVLKPDGLVAERGDLEACARCHADAPHEGLFGRAQ